jgi:hypothetical protein
MNGEVPPLTDVQRSRAMLIAMHVRNCLEELHGGGSRLDFRESGGEYRGLTDEQMALINPIVRNAVADMLHAFDHLELTASKRLITFTQMLVPHYWEQPELTEAYREALETTDNQPPPCRHCGRPVFEVGGQWYHLDAQGQRMRGCRAASFVSGRGWDETLDRRRTASPARGSNRG